MITSEHGKRLVSSLRRTFELIGDHRNEDEVTELLEIVVAHVRSMRPMVILGLPPMDESPAHNIVRRLDDGSVYEIGIDGGKVRLYIQEANGHDAVAYPTALEAIRFRADVAAVASSISAAEEVTMAVR